MDAMTIREPNISEVLYPAFKRSQTFDYQINKFLRFIFSTIAACSS